MKIGNIVKLETSSITPQKGIKYNLYSLPSFDDGKKYEIVEGETIQSNKYIVPNKCILFNKLNVRFKRVWRVDNMNNHKVCSTEFLPLVVNENIADYHYIYYVLVSNEITNYLCGQNANTSGSHKRINPYAFLNIDISLPELFKQKNISSILLSIDRKIEINKAINHNLLTPDHSLREEGVRLVA